MTHSAHIQTALEAACKFGRKQYDERTRFKDYDVSNALAALSIMGGDKCEAVATIGGGTSIAGKIKWLLENEGEMTSPAIAAKLNAKVETIRNVAHKLCLVGVIQRKSRGVFEPIKKGVMV
jgi:hypothetical protein